MNKRVAFIALVMLLTLVMLGSTPLSNSNTVTVYSGNNIELTCENDGTVSVIDTIIATVNSTYRVNFSGTYYLTGTLISKVNAISDPSITAVNVSYVSDNGLTTIFVNAVANLQSQKFSEITLYYKLSGLITTENGVERLRGSFNTISTAPPEVVVKIPKPSNPFQKVVIENMLPAPDVFTEESTYYCFVYKHPAVTMENSSLTLTDLSYSTTWDTNSIFWYGILTAISIIGGYLIGVLPNYLRARLKKQKEGSKFEIKEKGGKFNFCLKTEKGDILMVSKNYETKRECEQGIEFAKLSMARATYEDTK